MIDASYAYVFVSFFKNIFIKIHSTILYALSYRFSEITNTAEAHNDHPLLRSTIVHIAYLSCALFILYDIGNTGHSNTAFAYQLPRDNGKPSVSSPQQRYLHQFSEALASLSSQAKKALVFISTSKTLQNPSILNPFDFFFGIPQDPSGKPRKREGNGSGFFVDLQKGYIITNNHVIEDTEDIRIKLANERTYKARIVGRDSNTDVAVIAVDEKFDRTGLSSLVFHEGSVKVGELTIALGAPFRLEASVSLGVISATQRSSLEITRFENFIQTDAAINPGNSGGPLINTLGKVIGVNTAILSRSGGSMGVGFAIPSDLVRDVAQKLINDGKIIRGFIGLHLQDLTENINEMLSLPKDQQGVLVSNVAEGGPGERAGIKPGDVVISMNGKPTKTADQLILTAGTQNPGATATITIIRAGKKKTLKLTVAAWPEEQKLLSSKSEDPQYKGLGMELEQLSSELKKRLELKSSQGFVVTKIEPGKLAAEAGIQVGDLIVSINNQKVTSLSQLKKLLSSKSLLIRVERRGNFLFIAINR